MTLSLGREPDESLPQCRRCRLREQDDRYVSQPSNDAEYDMAFIHVVMIVSTHYQHNIAVG